MVWHQQQVTGAGRASSPCRHVMDRGVTECQCQRWGEHGGLLWRCQHLRLSPASLCTLPLLCRTYLLTVTSSPLLSDVLVLAGGEPADGYDDAREVSDPGEDAAPEQGEWEMPRAPEEGAGPMDAPRGEREI